MKVAIIEINHFQYGLTMSEVFEDCERFFFVTQDMYDKMNQYDSELCKGEFLIIEDIEKSCEEIIRICNKEAIDLFILNPIFDKFESALKICENIFCKKVITIHNLNFWLNSRFRTYKYYKERKLKQKIVASVDYIVVEEMVYDYLKNHKPILLKNHKFLSIPFTLANKEKIKKYQKENNLLKIVLPGSIHKDRRRYEAVIEVIHLFAEKQADISFSFAGKAVEDYGKWVVSELDKANEKHSGIANYFRADELITPDMFLKEMETSDLVLSTSAKEFKALGTTEYIGKTKSTGTVHDMTCFALPGLLPSHLSIPNKLNGSAFSYAGADELKEILQGLLDNPKLLQDWKEQASINSTFFTATEIRKNLPFF